MPALSESFRVIAPDLPGFGDSEKPSPKKYRYGLAAFTDSIADMYAALSIGRGVVVGHGLGGAIALTMAAQHPELVSRLVAIDPLCYDTPARLEGRIARVPFLGGLLFKQLWGRTAFRAFFRDRVLSSGARVDADRIDRYYDGFNTPPARGSTLATLRATVDTRSVVADTARINAPTLVVWGRHDRLYPAGYGQRLSRQIRGAGFELLSTGHAPQEEQPERVAQVIERFIRDERPSVF